MKYIQKTIVSLMLHFRRLRLPGLHERSTNAPSLCMTVELLKLVTRLAISAERVQHAAKKRTPMATRRERERTESVSIAEATVRAEC